MLETMLWSHASDNDVEASWLRCDLDAKSCQQQCYRIMLAMAVQLEIVLVVVRLRSPRAQSIEVLSHREEVGYSCWIIAVSQQTKYHSLGTSPYDKNLTLLNVSSKGFAHRLARTWCLHSLLDLDIRSCRAYES
jgi:hypothetical protein